MCLVSWFISDTPYSGIELISKRLMPLTLPCLAVSIFNAVSVTSEIISFIWLGSWTIGAQICTVVWKLDGLTTDLSSQCFSFFLHNLTSLAFWKGCNFLSVVLLYILVLQVMDGEMHREDFLIISIVGCFMG